MLLFRKLNPLLILKLHIGYLSDKEDELSNWVKRRVFWTDYFIHGSKLFA